jgi:hypothetical protein
MGSKDSWSPGGQLVMKTNRFRVKLLQRQRVAEIIEEEMRLLRDAIEGKRFDSQSRFFRGAKTRRFRGAQ